ncbi:crossover junction endodeoxyribonuclease RuvC [Duganella ginsengisoli]|uniref:Crossover junction endodeoxyribonuclease RuvC n=1 Tax=Pseudoduganella ginsengisoli TaxID=1462440 RepID=A0A6L6PWP5_9BURK|nr:crossover junction endodeoxyribonuclease RuvC [Pseudoduganella ginsengisoli]
MIILGIDPGLRTTGFGVIHKHGHKLRYIASGTIKSGEGELPARLKVILDGVAEVAATYKPDCAAIEKVFVNVNPQSTLLLGQARGAAICALVSNGLPVAEYSPTQLKQAVVGTGRAAKSQVQEMVARLLALPGLPGTDAADALGVAICHAHCQDMVAIAGAAHALLQGTKPARRSLRAAATGIADDPVVPVTGSRTVRSTGAVATAIELGSLRMRRGRLVG